MRAAFISTSRDTFWVFLNQLFVSTRTGRIFSPRLFLKSGEIQTTQFLPFETNYLDRLRKELGIGQDVRENLGTRKEKLYYMATPFIQEIRDLTLSDIRYRLYVGFHRGTSGYIPLSPDPNCSSWEDIPCEQQVGHLS